MNQNVAGRRQTICFGRYLGISEYGRRFKGWLPLMLSPLALTLLVPATVPRWEWMWWTALSLYGSCKWLTWRRTSVGGVPWWGHIGYLLCWPGMDAHSFLRSCVQPRPRQLEFKRLTVATWNLLAGGVILFWGLRWVPPSSSFVVGWIGMISIAMVLHFGLFQLLAVGWQALGVGARAIMNRPLAVRHVSEFWGRRWNTAFRDLTFRFLFRPIQSRWGLGTGVLVGFLISGLIHDFVISVPAGGGFGGPTFYFVCQGAAVVVNHRSGHRVRLFKQRWLARLCTWTVLLAPLPWLFHSPFIDEVVIPFLHALGAA